MIVSICLCHWMVFNRNPTKSNPTAFLYSNYFNLFCSNRSEIKSFHSWYENDSIVYLWQILWKIQMMISGFYAMVVEMVMVSILYWKTVWWTLLKYRVDVHRINRTDLRHLWTLKKNQINFWNGKFYVAKWHYFH